MMQSRSKPFQTAKTNNGWGSEMREKVPLGIKGVHEIHSRCVSSDYNWGVIGGSRAHPAADRTFTVTPRHENFLGGVRFNVEDVEAFEKDMAMPFVTASELHSNTTEEVKKFYADTDQYGFPLQEEREDQEFKIEVRSTPANNLVYAGSDGFLRACLFAFARHLPLAISPDHIWTLVTYAFAKHVDKHAEELREHFVRHEGKKRIEIRADQLRLGASSSDQWEARVFPQFSEEIKKHVEEGVHGDVVNAFSTTDATARACGEITLMATTKDFFSFGMSTMCGIPSVTLLGTEEDWVELRSKAEALSSRMTRGFRDSWMPCLLPILDEFVSSFRGNVNHGFWQSMVKLRDTGGGSGSYSFISGWVQNLCPYLGSGEINPHLRPWEHAFFKGPKYEEFPSIKSSAPVDWNYFGRIYNLHFHAGISGFSQHRLGDDDGPKLLPGTVMPALGWVVSHDPSKGDSARIAEIDQEVADLLKGHLPDLPSHHSKRMRKQFPPLGWREHSHGQIEPTAETHNAEEGKVAAIAMEIVLSPEAGTNPRRRQGGAERVEIDTDALKAFVEASADSPDFRDEAWVRRLGQLALERESLASG